MTPQKAKTYVKKIAEKKNLDSVLVDDIISFYYKKVRNSLTTLEYSRVKLDNLGTFSLKEPSLDKEEHKLTKMLGYIDVNEMTFMKHTKIDQISKKLDYIKKVKEIINLEKERLDEVAKTRTSYDKNKKDN